MSKKVYDKDLEKVSGRFGQGGEISNYLSQIEDLLDSSNELFKQITGDIIGVIFSIWIQPNPKAKLSEVINQINILIETTPSEKEKFEKLKTIIENIMDRINSTDSQN